MKRIVILLTCLMLLMATAAFSQFSGPAASYGVGASPSWVSASDLDCDGDYDLASANFYDQNVSILMNNGNGTFQTAVNYAVGIRPASVCAADFNGDGAPDLAVANQVTDNVSVLINNGCGLGTFLAAVNYGAGVEPSGIFAADLEGDGDIDLAVANHGSENVSILLNVGEGIFWGPLNYYTGWFSDPYGIFCSDFDGDGYKDLVVASPDCRKITVLLNRGDGTFSGRTDYTVPQYSIDVFGSDFDGNGRIDLATANMQSENVSVLLNAGGGLFWGANHFNTGGFTMPNSVFASDFDCDGDNDLVAGNGGFDDDVIILLNNGHGAFSSHQVNIGVASSHITAKDLDGDGDEDLAIAASGLGNDTGRVVIMLNQTDPVFGSISGTVTSADGSLPIDGAVVKILAEEMGEEIEVVSDTTSVAGAFGVADLLPGRYFLKVSKNGYYTRTDFGIVPEGGNETVDFALEMADFIVDAQYPAGDNPYSAFVSDLNGDGFKDLAVANANSDNISVYMNNHYGSFHEAVYYGAGDGTVSIVASDLDRDGDDDLAAANAYSNNISVFMNNGDGTYQAQVNYSVGSQPMSLVSSDFDGDLDNDIAVANQYSGNVSILLNNGDGTFQPPSNFAVGTYPMSLYAADFDGDSDKDLAVANGFSNNMSILINSGNGTFQAAVNYPTVDGGTPYSIYASDLDNDGDKDLAVANASRNNISVFKNNGNGTFSPAVNYAGGASPVAVCAFDADGDGYNDLATATVANWITDSVSVLFNNGNATFRPPINYVVGHSPSSLFPADLDNDGDIDIVAANAGSDSIVILRNQSLTGPPPCVYAIGDANNNGSFNGLDVVYSVAFFKGGPPPGYSCECTPGQTWYVAGDVNASCNFNGLDVSYMVSYLKGGPGPNSCADCPPARR